MRAGHNPPSVFTIFRYAAYLNKVQHLLFDLAFLHTGQIFHSLLEISGFTIIVRQVGFFSMLLPIISDYPSPDRTCCMEGGVSSAVAVIVHRLAPDEYSICYFSISIEDRSSDMPPIFRKFVCTSSNITSRDLFDRLVLTDIFT